MMTKFLLRVLTGVLLAIIINLTVENLSPHLRVQAALNGYRIMPLGASITAGVPNGDGYRIKLWNIALANKWNIHFLGSLSNGPKSLSDKHHEGHPGYRIDQITSLVDHALATYNPDMNGTLEKPKHLWFKQFVKDFLIDAEISSLKGKLLDDVCEPVLHFYRSDRGQPCGQ
ncbi:hypothetical protein [Nostoc sp.]|uniref:hypothetical protein n=1 Tax=Nostoc sp. TaxID=1180 RepID=UPI002FF97AEF